MNTRLLLSSILLLTSFAALGANECILPNEQYKCIGGDFYSFSVDSEWREFGPMGPVSFLFEASGKNYPPFYEKAPLIVTIAVFERPFDSLSTAKNDLLKTYSNFEDRVWEKDHSHSEELVELQSGQKAWRTSTRFFRSTKGLYQNRYELLAYSKEKHKALIFSVSIQHGDSSYEIAENLKFEEEIVDTIFSSIHLSNGD